MVAPRANWKGYIKFGEVTCPVALYTAASSSERISFHRLNRKTGNRVKLRLHAQHSESIIGSDSKNEAGEVLHREKFQLSEEVNPLLSGAINDVVVLRVQVPMRLIKAGAYDGQKTRSMFYG